MIEQISAIKNDFAENNYGENTLEKNKINSMVETLFNSIW